MINIAVLGSASGKGGFFPQGLNGAINGTSASIGSVASLDAKKKSPRAVAKKPMKPKSMNHQHHHNKNYHANTPTKHMG